MSLQGSLDTVSLPDVLSLLAKTAKTGELTVVGPHLDGHLWLDSGQLVGSSVGRSRSNSEALFNLLRISAGTFSFQPGQTPAVSDEPASIGQLLEQAEVQVSEWQQIEESVQSMDAVVRLVAEAPTPQVSLRSEQWRLLAAAAGGRTVRQVLNTLALGDLDGCGAIQELLTDGLVTVERPTWVEAQAIDSIAESPGAVATAAPAPAQSGPPSAARPPEPLASFTPIAAPVAAAPTAWSMSLSQPVAEGSAEKDDVEPPPARFDGASQPAPSAAQRPEQVADPLFPSLPAFDSEDDGPEQGDGTHDKPAKPIERGALLRFLSSVRS